MATHHTRKGRHMTFKETRRAKYRHARRRFTHSANTRTEVDR